MKWLLFLVWLGSCVCLIWNKTVMGQCDGALGMENGMIKDSQLSASTEEHYLNGARNARLNKIAFAWLPVANDRTPHIQVDFGNRVNITKVATQGQLFYDGQLRIETLYTATFHMMSSFDGMTWNTITDSRKFKIFTGNDDAQSIKEQIFSRPVTLRFLRILPQTCSSDGCALRFELYGCKALPTTTPPLMTTSGSPANAGNTSPLTSAAPPTTTPPQMPSSGSPANAGNTSPAISAAPPTTAPPQMTTSGLPANTGNTSSPISTALPTTAPPQMTTSGSPTDTNNASSAISAGSIAGAIGVLLVIAIIVNCWIKRQKSRPTGDTCMAPHKVTIIGTNPNQTYVNRDTMRYDIPKHVVQNGTIGCDIPKHVPQNGTMRYDIPKHVLQNSTMGCDIPKHVPQNGTLGYDIPTHVLQNSKQEIHTKHSTGTLGIYEGVPAGNSKSLQFEGPCDLTIGGTARSAPGHRSADESDYSPVFDVGTKQDNSNDKMGHGDANVAGVYDKPTNNRTISEGADIYDRPTNNRTISEGIYQDINDRKPSEGEYQDIHEIKTSEGVYEDPDIHNTDIKETFPIEEMKGVELINIYESPSGCSGHINAGKDKTDAVIYHVYQDIDGNTNGSNSNSNKGGQRLSKSSIGKLGNEFFVK
ncbi:uncharacterized protein [Amphiura filiformis]|uniref:uncharacterized protein isoform X2 n=1 Tax=Amphiura filiformis TaxID=82378 RepID=UPI003B225E59